MNNLLVKIGAACSIVLLCIVLIAGAILAVGSISEFGSSAVDTANQFDELYR